MLIFVSCTAFLCRLAPSTNLVDNIITGVVPALVLTGVGYLLAAAAPVVITAATNLCTNNPTACSYIGPIVDFGEQAIIATQYAYYGLVGDEENLVITTIKWQMELNDGGMPGNTLFNEASQQLSRLGPDALELVAIYGDEAIPLLLRHGDDAVDIISTYGKDGIALLQKSGEDTPEAIKLVRGFGNPSVDLLLNNLDAESVGRVLKNPDAINALLKWKPEEFKTFGLELVLRAERDAKAINALDELTKLDFRSTDPKVQAEVDRLIQEIADNSTHGSGDRFVLGPWDLENGIAGGYVNDARVNDGNYYGSHPDIYNKLNDLYGGSNPKVRDDILWALNQAALQEQIDKGVDFDYSMVSLVDKKYNQEFAAIQYMIAGNPAQAMAALERDTMPAKLKEIQVLLDDGYTPEYDEVAKVFHWTLNK